jgi:DNA-binding winged helix-turn-helix (wHTH) protein
MNPGWIAQLFVRYSQVVAQTRLPWDVYIGTRFEKLANGAKVQGNYLSFMHNRHHSGQIVRFGLFEVDLQTGELRKNGRKVPLQGQPFQVCALLLARSGELVTREELRQQIWPEDTFVDFDHALNTAITKIRVALGDDADNPRFIETLPRRGYRFIGSVEASAERNGSSTASHEKSESKVDTDISGEQLRKRVHLPTYSIPVLLAALIVASIFLVLRKSPAPLQRSLTRLTFEDGLQFGATWSPDERFIAYASDRSGKFDIWVQQLSGGDPVQVTHGPGQNWQPDWSPDGKYLAYRSEDGDGGLFITPALGGAGLNRKVASFGYYPQWSPDGSRICFRTPPSASVRAFMFLALTGISRRRSCPTRCQVVMQCLRHGIRTVKEFPFGFGRAQLTRFPPFGLHQLPRESP